MSLSAVLFGQAIETVSASSSNANRIVHVATAADHLTVIEVGEPVDTVAVGSKAFTVERQDDKVFVQSQEEHAKTNLFIWTASHRRYIYELETSSSVAEATFALDYPHVTPASKALAVAPRAPERNVVEELLLNGTPVRLIGLKTPQILSGRVGVQIHDIYEDREKGEMLIRYSVQNGSKLTYQPGQPTIVLLQPASTPYSLWAYRDTQIAGKLLRNLPAQNSGANLAVTEVRAPQSSLDPGHTSFGVLKVTVPDLATNDPQPRIVRFLFPSDDRGQVTATLIL